MSLSRVCGSNLEAFEVIFFVSLAPSWPRCAEFSRFRIVLS